LLDETKLSSLTQNREGLLIWLEQSRWVNVLDEHAHEFKDMFGIEDDPYTIGNFILGVIAKYPIYKTLPGGGGNSKLYVYSLHKFKKEEYEGENEQINLSLQALK